MDNAQLHIVSPLDSEDMSRVDLVVKSSEYAFSNEYLNKSADEMNILREMSYDFLDDYTSDRFEYPPYIQVTSRGLGSQRFRSRVSMRKANS